MFPCAYSLRSTQCAALIALAAAAGISRFEPADDGGREKLREPNREASETRATGCAKPSFFHLSIDRPSPWTEPLIEMVAWCLSAADDNSVTSEEPTNGSLGWFEAPTVALEILAPLTGPATEHSTAADRAPSARQHRFPYAVGPPAAWSQTPLRAEGTFVPGDSAARRSFRIATSFTVSSAHVARCWVTGPEIAGPIFFPLPSMALRGQPESPSTSSLGFVAPARIRARCSELL